MGEIFSKFTFTTEATTQSFHHRVITEESTHECETCYNQIGRDEPYSKHWLKDDGMKLSMTEQEEATMNTVDAQDIDTFFLCDKTEETSRFINETLFKTLPDLLRLNFSKAFKLDFNVALYVNVLDNVWIFESGYLRIDNHFDIHDCVYMLLPRMLKKISDHLMSCFNMCMDDSTIKNCKINVKRMKLDDDESKELIYLPMRCRLMWEPQGSSMKRKPRKAPSFSEFSMSEIDIDTITEAYIKSQTESNGHFPQNIPVNLHCIRMCETTKEVYIVPYHISETKSNESNRNFIIINDVRGKFKHLYEVKNLVCPDDKDDGSTIYICSHCQEKFYERTEFEVHNHWKCDREIIINTLNPGIVEVYHDILPFPLNNTNHVLYGMRTHTMIMNPYLPY